MRMLKDEMARMSRAQMEDKALMVEKLGDVSSRIDAAEKAIRSLRQQNADTGVKTEKIIAELQALRGEVEEVRHELGKTSKSVEDLLVRPPVSVATAENAPPVHEPSADSAKVEFPKEKEALFEYAQEKFKGELFTSTIEVLEVYLKRYKGDKGSPLDEAYFLKGEAFQGLANKGDNKKAKEDALKKSVLAYQNVLTGYPKSKHAAAVLYKIGQAFESLGFQTDAMVFYEEVIAKHKKSAFVPKAKKRIKKIKSNSKNEKNKTNKTSAL
jgi:TolA-binding protein